MQNHELKLFLEVELGLVITYDSYFYLHAFFNNQWYLVFTTFLQDLHPCPLPDKTKEDILLFFKLYDPEKEELRYSFIFLPINLFFFSNNTLPFCFWPIIIFRYVGRLFVKALGKPADILSKLNEMAGFSPSVEIQLFEVYLLENSIWSTFTFDAVYHCWICYYAFVKILLFAYYIYFLNNCQEIKFEPNVMCDHIDNNVPFHSSQVSLKHRPMMSNCYLIT